MVFYLQSGGAYLGVAQEIEDAIAFANDSPAPDTGSLTEFVYTEKPREAPSER